MEEYLNNNVHLYMDNYFTSVEIANLLLENNTYPTGTLRQNRIMNPIRIKKCWFEMRNEGNISIKWDHHYQIS